ncbi:MAG: hypothetical protein Q8922_05830 [Bacteroidota bacterium]|nr:hypothetical protein [Bacteroidota bacterium]MDP4234069.1 hypothetical protein [Bacteroidota bacterium]MDP4243010.1 hypothetical protein [Bacteroidota bacterium]MDP4287436.1 hypothetical protein [Bacteroidota bacterium]
MTAACLAVAPNAFAQHRKHRERAPVDTVKEAPEIKPDVLTLRYKPQAGTLLYNIKTEINQHVRTDRIEMTGMLTSVAQLALHNVSIDYKKGHWSFDRYFTRFEISGHQLTGDSLSLRENQAVNRITRLTFDMRGNELVRDVIDSIKLFNAEAQTNAYFFQPPRMLIPLPEYGVTYGDAWQEHTTDTIAVRDTVNIGITTGSFVYDVSRTYQLARLLDTMGSYLAMIVAVDSGQFSGHQSNTVTGAALRTHGPLSGSDTTYLDLFSGRVLKRSSHMAIPASVEVANSVPFTDRLDVRSVVSLSESNAKKIGED